MKPHDLETRIRTRAHQIWEEEGCPDGRAHIHWLRAEAEFREVLCGNFNGQGAHGLSHSPEENFSLTKAERQKRAHR
jgi:hypothetical protein